MYDGMRETKYVTSNSLNGRKFIFKLNRYLIEGTSNTINISCTLLASLNKKSLKHVASFLSEASIKLSFNYAILH